MGLFVMSARELDRLKLIEDISARRLSVVQGAELAGMSRRQMTRLVRAFKDQGASGLISKKRGKPSNRRHSNGLRDYAVELIRQNYSDFGPTLALEKLKANHDLSVSKETLRKWMPQARIWVSRKQRRRFHQPRLRREWHGELIQIDASEDRWFEDRSDPCTLLIFIDDATSKLIELRFVPSESTFSYSKALER